METLGRLVGSAGHRPGGAGTTGRSFPMLCNFFFSTKARRMYLGWICFGEMKEPNEIELCSSFDAERLGETRQGCFFGVMGGLGT